MTDGNATIQDEETIVNLVDYLLEKADSRVRPGVLGLYLLFSSYHACDWVHCHGRPVSDARWVMGKVGGRQKPKEGEF